MYYWKINDLKKDLVENKVSAHDKFLYLFFSLTLAFIALEAMTCFAPSEHLNLWDYIDALLGVIFGMLGILWAYYWNGGDKGKDFADRYFSIGWVMMIRFFALLACLFLLLIVIFIFLPEEALTTTWWEVVLSQLLGIGMYWRVAKHMKDLAKAT